MVVLPPVLTYRTILHLWLCSLMLASVVLVTSCGLHSLSPTALPRGLCRGRGGGGEGERYMGGMR